MMETTQEEIKKEEKDDVSSKEISDGFKGMILPPIHSIENKLSEISKNQKEILFIAQKETEEIKNLKHFREIENRFQKVPHYIQKAKNLKKDMKLAQDKLRKLRKRANGLKQDFGIQNQ